MYSGFKTELNGSEILAEYMKLRVMRTFFKVILAFMIAPVILLAWIMICTGGTKELSEAGDTNMKGPQIHVYPDLEILKVKDPGN